MLQEKVKSFFRIIGPGFVTGASDDDPSGIGTYAQTGVQFGYQQLWMVLFTFPFMTVIQEMCGRIGMSSGKGIARILKKHYSVWLLYFIVSLLCIANIVNIGADLAAMASAAGLVVPLPFFVWLLIITGVTILLQVLIPYRKYSQYLKYLGLSLLAYIMVAFVVKQDWASILKSTFIPSISFNKDYMMNLVAILGTTISPYLFFWQTGEEIEQLVERGRQREVSVGTPDIDRKDIREMRIDTIAGMLFSNIVMFFIIITMASTLGKNGIQAIESATQAAQALKPIAGDFAFLLFAVGIVGTGLLAVPVLAGSVSYAVSETFGWREGLSKKPQQALGFYGVITVATLIGFLLDFTGIKPFKMLYYAAILNGICAPPLMVMILLIGNNKTIMGEYANKPFSNILGWMITIVMGVAAIALLFQLGQPA